MYLYNPMTKKGNVANKQMRKYKKFLGKRADIGMIKQDRANTVAQSTVKGNYSQKQSIYALENPRNVRDSRIPSLMMVIRLQMREESMQNTLIRVDTKQVYTKQFHPVILLILDVQQMPEQRVCL